MRDYKQLTREVFLKSEEKINKRRRERSIILSSCAFLCLLAVVGTSTFFNAPTPLDTAGGTNNTSSHFGTQTENDTPNDTPNNTDYTGGVEAYFYTQIQYGENVISISDPQETASLYNAISAFCNELKDGGVFGNYYPSKGEHYDILSGIAPVDSQSKFQETLREKDITITFLSDKNVVKTFVLNGNKLIDINEQKETELSKDELLKLKQILQIKEEQK